MVLSEEQLKEVMERLLRALNEGLNRETHEKAVVRCFTTYVQDLPNGKGKFEKMTFRQREALHLLAQLFCIQEKNHYSTALNEFAKRICTWM